MQKIEADKNFLRKRKSYFMNLVINKISFARYLKVFFVLIP